MGAQDFFDLDFEQPGLFVVGKSYSHALCSIASRPARGYPGDLACHGVTLDVVGQRQQDLDVVAEFVLAGGRNEQSTLLEQRNVGRVERRLILDGQLDNGWPRSGCGEGTGVRRGAHGASL